MGDKTPARASTVSRRDILRGIGGSAVLLSMGSSILSACARTSTSGQAVAAGGDTTHTLAFSQPFSEVPVVSVVKRLTGDYAAEKGCELLVDNTQSGDIEDQLAALESWVTQKVAAICALPLDESAHAPIAQRAMDSGIAWITYGLETSVSHGGVLFPPDQSGQVIGEHVVGWLKENDSKAKVLLLTQSTLPAGAPRWEVPERLITSQTQATIVGQQDANDQASGQRVVETVLRAHPDLSVVVANNDDGALGAVQAFKNAVRDPATCYIGGQDGTLDALKAVREGGFFKATAALRLSDIATGIVDLSLRIIEQGPPAEGTKQNELVGPVLVDQSATSQLDELIATYEA